MDWEQNKILIQGTYNYDRAYRANTWHLNPSLLRDHEFMQANSDLKTTFLQVHSPF